MVEHLRGRVSFCGSPFAAVKFLVVGRLRNRLPFTSRASVFLSCVNAIELARQQISIPASPNIRRSLAGSVRNGFAAVRIDSLRNPRTSTPGSVMTVEMMVIPAGLPDPKWTILALSFADGM